MASDNETPGTVGEFMRVCQPDGSVITPKFRVGGFSFNPFGEKVFVCELRIRVGGSISYLTLNEDRANIIYEEEELSPDQTVV